MPDTETAHSAAEIKQEEERKELLDRTWRVLKRNGSTGDDTDDPLWAEIGAVVKDSRYSRPTASELGEQWGEGEYLLLRAGEEYDIRTVRVVAHVEYDEAEEEVEL